MWLFRSSIAPNTRSIWISAGEVSCSCIWISAGGLMYIFPQCNSLKIPGGLFLRKLSTPHFPKFRENDIYIKTFSPTITWILVLKKNTLYKTSTVRYTECNKLDGQTKIIIKLCGDQIEKKFFIGPQMLPLRAIEL